MRKLILLFAAGVFSIGAYAQQAQIFNAVAAHEQRGFNLLAQPNPGGTHPVSADKMARMNANSVVAHRNASHIVKKTTSLTTHNDWYDLWGQNTYIGGPQQLFYEIVYPDSNLIDDYSFSGTYVPWHGIGMSFDPTDSGYNVNAIASSVSQAMPLTGQDYVIDSFYVPIQYVRNNPSTSVVDSVIIEIIVTEKNSGTGIDSGSYNFIYTSPSYVFYPFTYDATPRWADARYTPGIVTPYDVPPYINDCYFDSVFTRKYRYALPLNNTNKWDTTVNGCIVLNQAAHMPVLPLSPAINIYSSDTRAVSYISFKSGVAYPYGTHSSVANFIMCFEGAPLGMSSTFMQSCSNPSLTPPYPGSYQNALYANNTIRYDNMGYPFNGHDILIPGSAYTTDPGLGVTLDSWHVNWTCNTPTVSAVTGATSVCVGATAFVSDPTPGGIWSSAFGRVSVSGGAVTGLAAGIDTIIYTVYNSCGATRVTHTVTVNPAPNAGFITGSSTVCVGASITLMDATTGGIWSASNGNATVAGGVINGVTSGTDVISYAVSNSCGTAYATKIITVSTPPNAGSITGSGGVCVGSTITLADVVAGGTWSTSLGNATVAGGVVTGVTAGVDTVKYTVGGGCANGIAATTVTVNPLPAPVITQSGATLSTTIPYTSYQWYFSGAPILGATGAIYVISANGLYSVEVYDANACGATSAASMIFDLGLHNTDVRYPVSIYPNPAESIVNIDCVLDVKVQLTTIDGRVVMEQEHVKQINVANLPAGNYLLNVYDTQTNVKLKTGRIVKVDN